MSAIGTEQGKEVATGMGVIPPEIDQKLKRGREALARVQARRLLGIEFANNHHYSELNDEGTKVISASTTAVMRGGEMPNHRVRLSNDIVSPMLQRKISAATQREPDWESTSVTSDPADYAAARIGGRLARAGYSLWGFPEAESKALWWAMVTEEAFGRAAFNSSIGPFIDVSRHPEADLVDENGEKPFEGQPDPDKPVWRGKGEIEVWIYSGLEVIWEPGVDFERSRWLAVEHVRAIEEIEGDPQYIRDPVGGKLVADGRSADSGRQTDREKTGTNLCLVTEYFERPSQEHPEGRWMTFAGGRKIFPDNKYPLRDGRGAVVDRPCLQRLKYDTDASSPHAKGLVQKVVDVVRTYDLSINKQHEYTQIGLVAQMLAVEGVVNTDLSDEPGLLIEYDRSAANGDKPEWRENIDFPEELFAMEDRARRRFSEITFDEDIPPQVESGKAISQVTENNRTAWQKFLNDFDRFRSAVMSDCLVLAQEKYGSDRLMKFRGATGWEPVGEFQGADLRDQTDFVVRQSSTQTQTRPQIEQRIMQLVQTFPNVFPPEVVIEALNSATPEKLIQGYEEDVGRAHRLISRLKDGSFWDEPLRPALPGEEALEVVAGRGMVPGWLPRIFDSLPVFKAALESWMKTDDWDRGEKRMKNASLFVYQKVLDLETQQQMRESEMQERLAEEQGQANASREPEKVMPSLPGGAAQPGGSQPATS